MKYDYYESRFDWHAAAVWLILATIIIGGIYGYRELKKAVDIVEMMQGPATPTEWTIVNGKVVLYQSPYYIQVTP
jgi:hypothetical protein